MATRDDLLALKPEVSAISIDGVGRVYVRQFSGAEFDALRKRLMNAKGKVNETGMMAAFVTAGACGPDGARLFTDADDAAVNGIPLKVLMAIFRAVQDANGLGNDDTAELVKNSEATTQN